MTQFTLPKWFDAHTHVRQEGLMAPILKDQADMGCDAILCMPNTKPPVAKILDSDDLPYWSLESYLQQIEDLSETPFETVIVPLYITKDTDAAMIEKGAKAGLLKACKYYPPHGTTGADFGVPMMELLKGDVFQAMTDNNVTLCIHGEEHGLPGDKFFEQDSNAEDIFYRERMTRLREQYPDLRIVCEHVTTRTAAAFVKESPDHIGATITPQHLLYTVGDLLQGLKYHLYCLPLLKFSEDRKALRDAAIDPNNTRFFAGTDSAPHTKKATACGCAAGCYTAGIAPQLYAEAFELSGVDFDQDGSIDIFKRFLCENGKRFYGLSASAESFTLEKKTQTVVMTDTSEGPMTPLPIGLGQDTIPWSLKL